MTPANIEKDRAPTLRDMRPIWKANGGGWHGPHVERWSIPEANMEAFAADLLRALTAENTALKERMAELELALTPFAVQWTGLSAVNDDDGYCTTVLYAGLPPSTPKLASSGSKLAGAVCMAHSAFLSCKPSILRLSSQHWRNAMSDMRDIIDRLKAACVGMPAKIAWPHYVLHDAIKEIEALRASLDDMTSQRDEARKHIANCCQCGRIIDTREADEGGDAFGCGLQEGLWVCSTECYDSALAEGAKP